MEESLDYNTLRDKLLMPEYGRHVQKMIKFVTELPDKAKRNEQIQAVVTVERWRPVKGSGRFQA